MSWIARLLRGLGTAWHDWHMRRSAWARLHEDRERLSAMMNRFPRQPKADLERQEKEFVRLQRLGVLYRELRHRRAMDNWLVFLVCAVVVSIVLMTLRHSSTAFQLKGRFSSVLFRTTTDLIIHNEDGAPWERRAYKMVVDTTWTYKSGTPFRKRGRLELAVPGGTVAMSHLEIPAGTLVRLQRDGNTYVLRMSPKDERRGDLSVHLLGAGGVLGLDGDSTTTYSGGLELRPEGTEYHVIQLIGLQLELPCMAVDSVRYVTVSGPAQEDRPRASTLAATLATGVGLSTSVELMQHDTLAVQMDGTATFCLRTDSIGLHITQTGRAVALSAGQPWRDAGSLDLRSSLLTHYVSSIPSDWRTFLLSLLVPVFGFLVLGNKNP